jgi:Holliday junction resolvase-like predicted endonuclease
MGGVEAQLEVDILADEVAMRVLIVEVRARWVKGAMRFIDCQHSIGSTAAVV